VNRTGFVAPSTVARERLVGLIWGAFARTARKPHFSFGFRLASRSAARPIDRQVEP
jgi:hypothetical protein